MNPEHLFIGTNQDNARDMWAKGRAAKIERKLTWPTATNIRVLYCRGMTIGAISSIYGVDDETIRHVVKGLSWLCQ
ncbi:hypothetical protein FRUB_06081 [Fimbriiglobus ruber]|uniref:Uncharacterized protein n=1 Tax=Fimbriiglobus ruber TaxID=1908690 RepID=A0A225DLU9_9BACT|nr:hypothetical protein FRUB_06081 [Fimbriiglobus ruber]